MADCAILSDFEKPAINQNPGRKLRAKDPEETLDHLPVCANLVGEIAGITVKAKKTIQLDDAKLKDPETIYNLCATLDN